MVNENPRLKVLLEAIGSLINVHATHVYTRICTYCLATNAVNKVLLIRHTTPKACLRLFCRPAALRYAPCEPEMEIRRAGIA
jgi:hypothetical protein